MKEVPLMPRATAVWLVENTTISFKQIAEFCNLHELEVQGIADGDVAKGIKSYNPILAGQLTREEIEAASKDINKSLKLNKKLIEVKTEEKKRPKKPYKFPKKITTGKMAILDLLENEFKAFTTGRINRKYFFTALVIDTYIFCLV